MTDIMKLLGTFMDQGVLGAVAAIAIFIAWKKDKQVTALYKRLENKSEKSSEKYHNLADELGKTMESILSRFRDK